MESNTMTTQTETKTAAQWKAEYRRLFNERMEQAHALPEYAALQTAWKAYEKARKAGDLDAMDMHDAAMDAATEIYNAAARRLPQHAELDRIDAMLVKFYTRGHAAGVRA
jgi:hypothetical protein